MLRQVREVVTAMKQEQNTIQIVISAQDLDRSCFIASPCLAFAMFQIMENDGDRHNKKK